VLLDVSGPGSVVGIATGYGLDGPGIESRWGARFSAPLQTGPGAHPTSCTMGAGSFSGVKCGRAMTLTPHPFSCRSQERVELHLHSPYGPNGLYRVSVPVQECTLPLPRCDVLYHRFYPEYGNSRFLKTLVPTARFTGLRPR